MESDFDTNRIGLTCIRFLALKLELYLVVGVLKLEIYKDPTETDNGNIFHLDFIGEGVFQKYYFYELFICFIVFVNCYQLSTWSPIW